MNNSNIKTVYITSDGREFSNPHEAEEHAEYLELSKKASETINNNLAQFLANKSKLKAGVLKRDTERLEKAWANWVKALPKSKNSITQLDSLVDETDGIFKKIYDALYALETATCRYVTHQNQLNKAKKYIPRLNAAIKGGPDFYPKDLIMVTPAVVSEW